MAYSFWNQAGSPPQKLDCSFGPILSCGLQSQGSLFNSERANSLGGVPHRPSTAKVQQDEQMTNEVWNFERGKARLLARQDPPDPCQTSDDTCRLDIKAPGTCPIGLVPASY